MSVRHPDQDGKDSAFRRRRRAANESGLAVDAESPVSSAPLSGTGLDPTSLIRVAVALPDTSSETLSPQRVARTMSVQTTAALARLGDPVEILRAESIEDLSALIGDPSVDVVLFDRIDAADLAPWLSVLAHDGPPSVVVTSDPSEEAALEAFRAGASDCVRFGPDYQDVLPIVLLEQIRRWRADRQRHLADQRIEWLEQLYSGIVAAMPAALAVVDPDGLIAAVNPEFDRLFPSRFESAEPAGSTHHEFIETRLPLELVAALSDSVQPSSVQPSSVQPSSVQPSSVQPSSAQPEREPANAPASATGMKATLVRVEGSDEDEAPRAYEIRCRRLDAQGRQVLLISDVTESEFLSTRVERLRRDNRNIIENLNSALLVVEATGCISFANPAAERILGEKADDLDGRSIADWFGQGSDGQSPIEDCLLHGERSRGAETLLRRSDGQWIPVGVSCSPRIEPDDAYGIEHAANHKHGVVAVFQDLSEIKKLELQVRQTEKMASIGQLAAGVAHEVNNPMGFIHANLHQMTEYLADLDRHFLASEKLQDAIAEGDLETIRAAAADVADVAREIDLEFVRSDFAKALSESSEGAERIRHIVRDLRDFSRPDLPARTPADINQAIDSTANIVWAMMKRDVHLERDYGELPKLDAYPMQLKQVFMNLLVNGYQAIEARGERERGVMRIETAKEGDEIVIRISDSGIGISDHDQKRIFEPFFTTKPVGSGTGLGLSTSYTIIERHGGRMSVSSVLGEGTTFEVRLPCAGPSDASDSVSG